jgi:hypothetical protein
VPKRRAAPHNQIPTIRHGTLELRLGILCSAKIGPNVGRSGVVVASSAADAHRRRLTTPPRVHKNMLFALESAFGPGDAVEFYTSQKDHVVETLRAGATHVQHWANTAAYDLPDRFRRHSDRRAYRWMEREYGQRVRRAGRRAGLDEGDTRSPYTSWSKNRSVAERCARPGGVVLESNTGNRWFSVVSSPDLFREDEILIRGPVIGEGHVSVSEDTAEDARRALELARNSDALTDEAQQLLAICSVSTETEYWSGMLNVRELRDIAASRQRVQEDPKREAPRFRGFGELQAALSGLADNDSVRLTTIIFDEGSLRIYTDQSIEVMYGLVYAGIPGYSYWRKYVKGRQKIAYMVGYQDGVQGVPPREPDD